jgi:hypothetical protein
VQDQRRDAQLAELGADVEVGERARDAAQLARARGETL